MIVETRNQSVTMNSKDCKLQVRHAKKTSWTAAGQFDGVSFLGEGRTAEGAVRDWMDRVQRRGE